MRVAKAAFAATGNQNALANFCKVGDGKLAGFINERGADRHFQGHILAACTCAIPARAVFAALGFEVLLVAIVDQRVQIVDRLHIDVSALAAIAAVGATKFHKGFAAEADTAISTTT